MDLKRLFSNPDCGGVTIASYKSLTRDCVIVNVKPPNIIFVSLQQHLGAPAMARVAPGDYVRVGQLIGEAHTDFSANVHAPVSGTVQRITEMPLVTGKNSTCIVIESDTLDQTIEFTPNPHWEKLDAEEMIRMVNNAGIVGMGGAAFPAPLKLKESLRKKVDVLLVNGAECEPYLTADFRVMVEHAADIVEGVRILKRILNVSEIVICIERHYREAARALHASLAPYSGLCKIVELKTRYPQGAEKVLIHSVLGRVVPSGGLPGDVGVVVHNVQTVAALRTAVVLGKPLYERVLTVSGSAIAKPANLRVRLGMPIQDIVDLCGGFTRKNVTVVAGGPMMGKAVDSLAVPVVKGLSGIVVLDAAAIKEQPYEILCINCGRCMHACPMGLNPSLLAECAERDLLNDTVVNYALDCCGCGACSVVCPAHRNNNEVVQQLKARLGKK